MRCLCAVRRVPKRAFSATLSRLSQYAGTAVQDNPFRQIGRQSILCINSVPFLQERTNGLAWVTNIYRKQVTGSREGGILFDLVNYSADSSLPDMLDSLMPCFPGPKPSAAPAVPATPQAVHT